MKLVSDSRPVIKRLVRILEWILLFVEVVVLFALLYFVPGYGIGTYIDARGEIVPMKTFWDWLELAIVPLFLLLGGAWINSSLRQIERERTEKHTELERQIADDRLKEQALQSYLDRMSELLLSGAFEKPDTVMGAKTVARARTLTVLRGLDGERKGTVLKFLYESELISGEKSAIDLQGADFSQANLGGARLILANLAWANLTGAKLPHSFLLGAYLMGTQFEGANLEGAFLQEANLQGAFLQETNLQAAEFENADLRGANLWGANLMGAKITAEQLTITFRNEATTLPDSSHPNTRLP